MPLFITVCRYRSRVKRGASRHHQRATHSPHSNTHPLTPLSSYLSPTSTVDSTLNRLPCSVRYPAPPSEYPRRPAGIALNSQLATPTALLPTHTHTQLSHYLTSNITDQLALLSKPVTSSVAIVHHGYVCFVLQRRVADFQVFRRYAQYDHRDPRRASLTFQFFRWISERYPLTSQLITPNSIPTFDNL